MYVVSDKFKSAIESTSRSMNCKAYLRGIEFSVDKILKLDIEDNINNGDYFTIGEVPSRSLTIEMIGVQGLVEGDEIKPYYGVEVSPGEFEYVPCGVFYVDSLTINKDKISATCYDKMLSLEEEYTPNIAIPVTLTEIMNDICQQKGIEFEGELPNITLSKSIKGYSYREMIGFIASFCGGNAKLNRIGKLVIQQNAQTGNIVNTDVCASFEHKDVYTVSAIACKFGDVANTRGDSSANCVNFTNPYVDDSNIDSIFNLLNGLTFTAANFKYKGDPSVDSGDLITINDVKGNSHVVLVSTQDFKFSGGLTSEITSIGEGKGANAYKQYKFKNKKSITELNVELGLIQGIISEVQEKQEDTYTKTETETLIEAKAGEISLSVAKTEVNKTLKNYPTTTEMNSAILQKANEITSTVEVTKSSGVEIIPQSYTVNSTSGFKPIFGHLDVRTDGLLSRTQSQIETDFIPVDRTKPIHCSYDFATVGNGQTCIFFMQYKANKDMNGDNNQAICLVDSGVGHTGRKMGEYTINAQTLLNGTRYVKLRLLVNWDNNSAFQYTYFYKLSALQLQSRTASTQIAQMSDQIALKVEADGVKSIIQQNPESVRIGFNAISNYFDLNSTRLQVGHSDGSYTQIGQNGIVYYDSHANWKYHSLMKQGWLGDISGTSWSRTVTLPASFRNKTFSVIISVEMVNAVNTHDVIKHYKVTVPQNTVNYANGTFVINMSALAYWVPGQGSATDIITNVSWIAIA